MIKTLNLHARTHERIYFEGMHVLHNQSQSYYYIIKSTCSTWLIKQYKQSRFRSLIFIYLSVLFLLFQLELKQLWSCRPLFMTNEAIHVLPRNDPTKHWVFSEETHLWKISIFWNELSEKKIFFLLPTVCIFYFCKNMTIVFAFFTKNYDVIMYIRFQNY